MSGAGQAAVEQHVGFPAKMAAEGEQQQRRSVGGCNPVRKPGPVSMDHVLLALCETKEEREVRFRSLFNFFDAAGLGYLDYAQIEAGLSALRIPAEYKYARDLLKVCDANRDGRVDYQEFRRYMDDKELELYRIFQAIDVEHNGCILPEELWDALVKAVLGSCEKWAKGKGKSRKIRMQSKDVELAVLETSELTTFPCSVQNLRRTIADKTKTPPSLLNPKKQKRWTKQGPCKTLIPEKGLITTEIAKYWHQRYSLFSRYDDGIQMDEEGWFSATPEEIAATHAARASSGTIVIDCFSGVGGNAIQFASRIRGCHVVAIDIDPLKIGYAINNAKIYGVEDNIDFIVGDFFQLAPFLKADVVFLSPPWGGPSYNKIQNFTLDLLKPRDGYSIFQVAQKITPNIIMFLPRNVDINQVEELSWLSSPPLNFEIEESHVQGYTKGITAYFGYIVSGSPGLSKLSEVATS